MRDEYDGRESGDRVRVMRWCVGGTEVEEEEGGEGEEALLKRDLMGGGG